MRTRAVTVTAVCLAVSGIPLITACGHETATSRSSTGAGDEAGATAVAYTTALMRGDRAGARAYVAPQDVGAWDAAVADLLGKPAGSDLRVGSSAVQGTDATVVLTGSMCQYPGQGKPRTCVTNTQPQSADPVFTVHLTRVGDAWKVTFPDVTTSSDASTSGATDQTSV